jgi:hypothetical protein
MRRLSPLEAELFFHSYRYTDISVGHWQLPLIPGSCLGLYLCLRIAMIQFLLLQLGRPLSHKEACYNFLTQLE